MVASILSDKRLDFTLTLQFPKYQIVGDMSPSNDNEVVVHTLIQSGEWKVMNLVLNVTQVYYGDVCESITIAQHTI